MTNAPPSVDRIAFIAFSPDTELWWLRPLLRQGFRHCFAFWPLDRDHSHWLILDSLSHGLVLETYATPKSFDLGAWFDAHGLRVIRVHRPPIGDVGRARLWAPLTCVEIIKRLLGINQFWPLTPWGLYRLLQTKN